MWEKHVACTAPAVMGQVYRAFHSLFQSGRFARTGQPSINILEHRDLHGIGTATPVLTKYWTMSAAKTANATFSVIVILEREEVSGRTAS